MDRAEKILYWNKPTPQKTTVYISGIFIYFFGHDLKNLFILWFFSTGVSSYLPLRLSSCQFWLRANWINFAALLLLNKMFSRIQAATIIMLEWNLLSHLFRLEQNGSAWGGESSNTWGKETHFLTLWDNLVSDCWGGWLGFKYYKHKCL